MLCAEQLVKKEYFPEKQFVYHKSEEKPIFLTVFFSQEHYI